MTKAAEKQKKSCFSSQQYCQLEETASLPSFELLSKPSLEHGFWQGAHSVFISAVFLQEYLNSRRKKNRKRTMLPHDTFGGRLKTREDTVNSEVRQVVP